MKKGKSYDDETFDIFFQNFKQGIMDGDTEVTYNQWIEDGHPDPRESCFKPRHQIKLARKLLGKVYENQNTYFCYENCKFGYGLFITKDLVKYKHIAFTFLCSAQHEFRLYDASDIKMMMEETDLDSEDPEEYLFVKKCISNVYSGQTRAHEENRESSKTENNNKS